MFTRQHYKAIAAVLSAQRNSYGTNWDPNLFRACDDVANMLADMLEADNGRFDRPAFLTACMTSINRAKKG